MARDRSIDDEYLFCKNFLVAPVFQAEGERKIYLPEGDWIDYWTHENVVGGRWITRFYPLERLPLFVKAGSILLKTVPGVSIEHHPIWDHLIIEIYPGLEGQIVVHQSREHGGSISFAMQSNAIFVTTEGILGTPTIRLIGEQRPCFLNGERV